MLNTIFDLIGMNLDDYIFDDNVLFTVTALLLLFCLGYVFNFFQTALERLTAKRK